MESGIVTEYNRQGGHTYYNNVHKQEKNNRTREK